MHEKWSSVSVFARGWEKALTAAGGQQGNFDVFGLIVGKGDT